MKRARAVYSEADIYLFDDIWNEFEPKLAKTIFKK